MATKKYKLTYFPLRGIAESIRYLFHAAGVDFEDNRLPRDKWPDLKPSTPFGQMPILEVDGKVICQTKAICRYLGTVFNLNADNPWDNARIDMVVDCLEDARMPFRAILHAPDEDTKKKNIAAYAEVLPTHLANLEKMLCENNSGNGFFVGDKMTWADVTVAAILSLLESAGKRVEMEMPLDKYTKLTGLRKRVEASPGIAAYIANRPVTDI